MPAAPASPTDSSQWVARCVGWLSVLAFAGIATTHRGFYVDFHPPFTRVGPGESNLWLSSALLLFPATCLVGYGYHQRIGGVLLWLHAQLHAMSTRERALALLSLTLIAVAAARLCNAFVLFGYPVTDDEWAARFGGEVLATGHLTTPLPVDKEAYPWLFSFIRDGRITSFDWLGVQIPWAIAALTGTGNWVFAVAAALPVPCIAWTLSRRLGPSWGSAGAFLFLFSPMAFALSMSSHGHLGSRALVALVFALYVLAEEHKTGRAAFALGLALGAALTCRPFEVCFMMAPLFLADTWLVLRHGDRAARTRWCLLLLGVLIPVGIFFLHTYALTGGLTPARHHPLQVGGVPTRESSYWVRFGSNSAFNALRLAVWFAGPLGVGLFAAGVMTDRFTRFLALGVASTLALGLFHDNYGVHVVGPIHYSECVVPLTLVAVHGLSRLTTRVRSLGLTYQVPAAITATWLVIGLGPFNAIHAAGMQGQALTQRVAYDWIDEVITPDQRPAVLFAPMFYHLWQHIPEQARRGTWVYEWRRPRPDFSDDILILHDRTEAAVASAHAAFPTRKFFYMRETVPKGGYEIVPAPPWK